MSPGSLLYVLGKRGPEGCGRHLYVRTYTAWYQLKTPAFRHQRVYATFWLPRRLGQAVIEAVTLRPKEKLEVVLEHVSDSEAETTIGRPLSFSDVQANVNDSLRFLQRFSDVYLQWSTICLFLGFPWPLGQAISKVHPLRGIIELPQTEKFPTTLKNRSPTGPLGLHWRPPEPLTVMPTVHEVAKGLFRRPLRVVAQNYPPIPEPEPPKAESPRFSKLTRKKYAEYEELGRVYENVMETTRPDNTPHVWKVRQCSTVISTAGHLLQIGDAVSVRLKRSFQEHEAMKILHLEVKRRNTTKTWKEYNKLADDWW